MYYDILLNSENDKEYYRDENWLNLNEKSLTTLFLILKVSKSKTEKKTGLFFLKNLSPVSF